MERLASFIAGIFINDRFWSRREGAMYLYFVVASFIVIALAGLLLGFVRPARRSTSLEQMARELNFTFSAQAKPFEKTDVRGLAILEDGPSTIVDNLLERTIGRCGFLICDINSLPPQGETTMITTIAAFQMPEAHLPVFQIGEKNTIERAVEQIEHAFGKKLDQFDDDHEFARNFFVHCAAKGEMREFLTPAKLSYLREHATHFHVEGSPDWLLIYGPGSRVDADGLKEFSEITSAIASVLLSIQLPKAS